MSVDVRRAADRGRTRLPWLDSRHSLSYGHHYDPANTSFGLLLAHNDDVVAAGAGFDDHAHRDVEVVTWVVEGALEHRDSAGHHGVLRPGQVQRMSAGRGVVHSERAADGGPVRLVQVHLVPDELGVAPSYAVADVDLTGAGLVPVVSGAAAGAVGLGCASATLHAGRLAAGEQVRLPDATHVHLYVVRGAARLDSDVLDAGALDAGDAVRLRSAGTPAVTAVEAAELLVWEMHLTSG